MKNSKYIKYILKNKRKMSTLAKNPSITDEVGVSPLRQMLNKVPEITIWFWIIKIMATTVGETAADFLTFNLHWGLSNTTIVMTVLFLFYYTVHTVQIRKM